MTDAMSFTLGQADLHPAFNALDLALTSRGQGAEGRDGDGFRLSIANALWSQRGMHVEADFLDVLAESYDAGLRLLDFGKAEEAAAATAVMTAGGIPTLLSVDRPFVFFIRDIDTGRVLFVGRVLDPTL